MRSKWSVLRVWLMMVCVLAIAGGLATPAAPAQASDENNVRQDDKQDEKKEEKKDEKKGLTLKPDRKVEFTTDEGTWLSLDVSPDGKTIVFELLGDLYTLPIEGGQAKLISGGMAFDSQPKFSPDGKCIFVSKAPSGIGAYELWMYHVDGGSGIQITKSRPSPTVQRKDRPNDVGVVASADGKYLYYAERHGPFSYNTMLPLWEIKRKDRKTGDEDTIIQQSLSAFRPVLSPDGKSMLYVSRFETESGLRMRNLETGEDKWVRYPITRDDQESRFTRDVFPGYAFVSGAQEIVYNQDGKIRRLNVMTGAESIIPFAAQVSQELGPKLDFPQ